MLLEVAPAIFSMAVLYFAVPWPPDEGNTQGNWKSLRLLAWLTTTGT